MEQVINLGNSALKYASLGLAVFPCHFPVDGQCSCKNPQCGNIGKHPKTEHGMKDATLDQTQIKEWWLNDPLANIAIACGSISGIVVAEFDTLDAIQGKVIPATVTALSGRGLPHFYFRYHPKIINDSIKINGKETFSIRTDGRYVIAPPSLHYTGNIYQWSREPGSIEIAIPPDWLFELPTPEGAKPSTVPDIIPNGSRDNTLYTIACSLRAKGLSENEILVALLEMNRTRCKPPLAETQVREKTKQACKHPAGRFLTAYQNNGSAPNLELTPLGTLLAEPEPQYDWQLEHRLPVGGSSMVVAKPKVGKSTWGRCLAIRTARGQDFMGFKTRQGKVIYLALEEKREEVRRHFQRMDAKEDDPILLCFTPNPQNGIAKLREIVEQECPVLIIVDPLFKFIKIKDCNDYAEVSAALTPLLSLARDTGAHVMTMHHESKIEREGGDQILGSTALFAAVDTVFSLKRTDRYRTIKTIQRYGEDMREITLEIDDNQLVSAGVERHEADLSHMDDTIREFLGKQKAPVEEKTIHEAVEGRRELKIKSLRRLVEANKVVRTGSGKKGDPFLYSSIASTQ